MDDDSFDNLDHGGDGSHGDTIGGGTRESAIAVPERDVSRVRASKFAWRAAAWQVEWHSLQRQELVPMSTLSLLTRGTFAALILGAGACAQAQATSQTPQTPSTATSPSPAGSQATIDAAFKQADTNADGKLSNAELGQIPALASRFADLDKDKDGSVSTDEFSTGVVVKGN